MFSISNFRASVDNKGVLKSNRFFVNIPKPKVVASTPGEMLTLRCESVTVPGIDLTSADGPPKFGYGPQQKHPYNATFPDISASFLVDSSGDIQRFFYQWVSSIVNFNGRGGTELHKVKSNGMRPYESAYKDDFAVTLTIDVYSDDAKKAYSVKAYQAFPTGMPTMSHTWSEEGDLIRLRVPFTYTDFELI